MLDVLLEEDMQLLDLPAAGLQLLPLAIHLGLERVHQLPEGLGLPLLGGAYVLPLRGHRLRLGIVGQLHRPPEPLGRRHLVGLERPPADATPDGVLGAAQAPGSLLY